MKAAWVVQVAGSGKGGKGDEGRQGGQHLSVCYFILKTSWIKCL